MNVEAIELMALARRLSSREGSRRAAGRLFNAAALILAEDGVSNDELCLQLKCAFMRFDADELETMERH